MSGLISRWNRGAELMTGYSASDAVGRPISILYRPDEQGRSYIELQQAASTGRFEEEGVRIRKDGKIIEAHVGTLLETQGGGGRQRERGKHRKNGMRHTRITQQL